MIKQNIRRVILSQFNKRFSSQVLMKSAQNMH